MSQNKRLHIVIVLAVLCSTLVMAGIGPYRTSPPNDPLFNEQWSLANPYYPGIDISALDAWGYATGKGVKIAILDCGVQLDHADLSPNISGLSYDVETANSPSQVYGEHGTHCAGIAAAARNNNIQIAGVAPDATILPISVDFDNTEELKWHFADGIIWAYQHGADIISCSWHLSELSVEVESAIRDAFRYGRQGRGCVIVFASGNHADEDDEIFDTHDVNYPANCNDTILVVGAITNEGNRSTISNFGETLDLVAPGDEVISALPTNSFGFRRGTSMACPHVAGVAALVLERNPELTVTEVNDIICSNAKKLSGVNFDSTKPYGSWNNEYGYGLVDASSSARHTPKIEYIQNDTITGNYYKAAEKIYIGRDVTDRKEYGDVVLGPNADIMLNAKRVVIKNSTKVPLGTSLYITYQEE